MYIVRRSSYKSLVASVVILSLLCVTFMSSTMFFYYKSRAVHAGTNFKTHPIIPKMDVKYCSNAAFDIEDCCQMMLCDKVNFYSTIF